jgi:hypothetical protein
VIVCYVDINGMVDNRCKDSKTNHKKKTEKTAKIFKLCFLHMLGQVQNYDRVKPVNGIPPLPS